MNKPVIIIVEDDAVISELLAFNLKNDGYTTLCYRDGAALFLYLDKNPDTEVTLFILDIMLPGMDGFAICSQLRADPTYKLVPILMLTARGAESDKVKGLDAGADDYLTKPFGMREFLARVQSLNRRYQQMIELRSSVLPDPVMPNPDAAAEQPEESVVDDRTHPGRIQAGEILLDDIRHRVFRRGVEVEMTHREYELLKFLMIHRGVAYSRDDLLNFVWGYEYSGETRTVDVHIRQLRRKLEPDDANPVLIETVRGRGYRYCEENSKESQHA